MSLIVVVLVAFLIGYVTRRWILLFLGPAAGAAIIGLAAVQDQNPWDEPAVFIALIATAALAAGVALGRANRISMGTAEAS